MTLKSRNITQVSFSVKEDFYMKTVMATNDYLNSLQRLIIFCFF